MPKIQSCVWNPTKIIAPIYQAVTGKDIYAIKESELIEKKPDN